MVGGKKAKENAGQLFIQKERFGNLAD